MKIVVAILDAIALLSARLGLSMGHYPRDQAVTAVLASLFVAQMIIGHPNLKLTIKALLSEGAKVVAIGTIAVIAAKVRRPRAYSCNQAFGYVGYEKPLP